MTPAAGGGPVSYGFKTLDNQADPTFNQLLGINNDGTIAGYFGSGAAGHPNQGYRLLPPHGHGSYQSENFPGSVQTQVTGLNNKGVTVGFWSSANNASMVNDNSGFWARGGQFHTANFPAAAAASPPVDQLLGVNDSGVAVGFWTDANGDNHGYLVNVNTGTYRSVTDPNAPSASLTAAAINSGGGIAGFYTNQSGNTDGFLMAGGDVHRPVRARRVVHDGARRERQRRGGRHVHGRQRRQRGNARVQLDAGRRLPEHR